MELNAAVQRGGAARPPAAWPLNMRLTRGVTLSPRFQRRGRISSLSCFICQCGAGAGNRRRFQPACSAPTRRPPRCCGRPTSRSHGALPDPAPAGAVAAPARTRPPLTDGRKSAVRVGRIALTGASQAPGRCQVKRRGARAHARTTDQEVTNSFIISIFRVL